MSAITSFAQKPGRPGSAQSGRPTSASRRQIAAKAKAQVPRTGYNPHESPQQYPLDRGLSISHGNPSVTSQQELGFNLARDSHVKHDPYDTDVGSIDTTARDSMAQIKDSQETENAFEESDGDEEGEDNNEDGHNTDSLPWDEDEIQVLENAGLLRAPQQEQFRHLVSKGTREPGNSDSLPYLLGGDDSYPTTTSGIPDGFSHGLHGDQEYGSDGFEIEGNLSPSPQRLTAANIPHHQPTRQASGIASTTNPEANIFQKSAAIRVSNRSNVNFNAKVAQNPHENDAFPPSQPPSYSQVTRRPNSISVAHTSMRTTGQFQSNQALPQHLSSNTKPVEPPVFAGQAARVKQHTLTTPSTPQQKEEEQSTVEVETRPVEDYDRPALFGMDYTQLSKEDFDTVPRASRTVLSDDMHQKPLAERLEHVKKSLTVTDQDKFFSSLSTAEWEDAGDWFLDQFSAIISRTREARQSKRKLAIDFEKEVEERHKRVTKKHRQVDVSLDSMKARGKSLIPKSPGRTSK